MKLDKKKQRLVAELRHLTWVWLKDVKSVGNQTAWSDDVLDAILKKAAEIQEVVNKQFGNCPNFGLKKVK